MPDSELDLCCLPALALLALKGSPRTLLLALVVCLSHVAAKSCALAEALVSKHSVLNPLSAFIQGANTPPDIKAASLNACAQVRVADCVPSQARMAPADAHLMPCGTARRPVLS